MAQTRRDVLTAGAVATLSVLTPGAMTGAAADALPGTREAQAPSLALAYQQAFAEFEAAVRPSSEIYWTSHNRAVADVYARDMALRRTARA